MFYKTYAAWIDSEDDREAINLHSRRPPWARKWVCRSNVWLESPKILERDTGLEPVAYSLGSCRSTR